MSAAGVLKEESFVGYLKPVALIGLRGHRRGRNRRKGEQSLVAAVLSKTGAGVALLVREVSVALLLCFSRKGGICVSVFYALRVLSRCRNRTRSLNT